MSGKTNVNIRNSSLGSFPEAQLSFALKCSLQESHLVDDYQSSLVCLQRQHSHRPRCGEVRRFLPGRTFQIPIPKKRPPRGIRRKLTVRLGLDAGFVNFLSITLLCFLLISHSVIKCLRQCPTKYCNISVTFCSEKSGWSDLSQSV